MRTAFSWVVRVSVIAICGFVTAWSVRMAMADIRAQKDMEGLESAIRLEPADSFLLAREALIRSENGDMSQAEDGQLLRAAEEDPLNANVQMALGLREEFRGHLGEAERYLVHAAEIDHTYKPAWTLASFYVRNDQPEKSWPMMRRALSLDPLAFDAAPVFDLCWNESNDSKKILDLIPARGLMPVKYLYYLMLRKRIDAAVELWPRALGAADPSDPGTAELLTGFAEFLQQADRTSDAVRVWNQLVERGIVCSGRLDPAKGTSVADAEFNFPLLEKGFGWRVAHEPGVSVVKASSSLRFEFDGNEPESSVLLNTLAPLIPGKAYRLVWKTDASRLSAPRDPGFVLQIVQQPGGAITDCRPLLQAGDNGVCLFTSLPGANKAQLKLIYKRALGTTRVDGTLRLENVHLEFGS